MACTFPSPFDRVRHSHLKRLRFRRSCFHSRRLSRLQEQASTAETAVSEPPVPEALPEFISNDGVSYWVHEGKESNIWLVGVVHGTKAGEKVKKCRLLHLQRTRERPAHGSNLSQGLVLART